MSYTFFCSLVLQAKRALSTLSIGDPQYYDGDGPMTQYKKDKIKPIYFNSNDYHGNRFLSNEAMDAGYSDSKTAVSDYALIMQQGVGTMVREDAEATLVAAENILLQNLVRHYPESRNAVRDARQKAARILSQRRELRDADCTGPEMDRRCAGRAV